jgi:hypothetical protein
MSLMQETDLLGGVRESESTIADQVMFRIAGLYAFARESVRVRVSPTESVDSGLASITLDPEADASTHTGVADFEKGTIRMRYGAQVIFPGLHELVRSEGYDRSLLNPPRATAMTDCRINKDYDGWEAQTCIEFLPGSMWSAAGGG